MGASVRLTSSISQQSNRSTVTDNRCEWRPIVLDKTPVIICQSEARPNTSKFPQITDSTLLIGKTLVHRIAFSESPQGLLESRTWRTSSVKLQNRKCENISESNSSSPSPAVHALDCGVRIEDPRFQLEFRVTCPKRSGR